MQFVHVNASNNNDNHVSISTLNACKAIIQAYIQLYYKYVETRRAIFVLNIQHRNRRMLVELFDSEYCKRQLSRSRKSKSKSGSTVSVSL